MPCASVGIQTQNALHSLNGIYHAFPLQGGGESSAEDEQSQPGTSASSAKSRSSLSQIVLSLESNVAKQQALQHILVALQILNARDCLVSALSSHSSNVVGTPRGTIKCSPDSPADDVDNNPLLQIAQGGGEALAVADAMVTVSTPSVTQLIK